MRSQTFSDNTLHTALAAVVGLAAATVVKLLLDETVAPAVTAGAPRPDRQAKLKELQQAAHDPQYLADMQEVNDDFAFVDSELL